MRKSIIIPLSLVVLSAFSFQSCIGSFSLTNKVLTWNRNVSNKFVNEVVFFAFWVLPVYEVTAAADLLVINSIEFWSGNTPLEANNKVIDTDHGQYKIETSSKGYAITSPDGNLLRFDFDAERQMWSFALNDEPSKDFLRFVDDSNIRILGADGEFVDVELNEEGVEAFKTSSSQMLWASL